MCYGSCAFETYMGECGLCSDERKYLENLFGSYCAHPYCEKEVDSPIFDKMVKTLYEYRDSKLVMAKLCGKKFL